VAVDFQADMTADGRALRLVNVVDEFTREALVMQAERSITADQTVAQLEALVARRERAPRFLRCDNGPELTSHALRDWCRFSVTQTAFIQPGAMEEPVRGVLPRPRARRAAQHRAVRVPHRSPGRHRRLA
jgi:hypothetical protein